MKNSVELIGFYGSDEVIACIIEDKNLNFNLGNMVKYVALAGKKDKSKEKEDLKKALWYLERIKNNYEK